MTNITLFVKTNKPNESNSYQLNANYLCEMLRGANHTNYILQRIREQINRQDDNTMNRIKYIVGEYSESKFKTILSKQFIKRNKNNRILHILELVNAVCIDNFKQLQDLLKAFNFGINTATNSKKLIKNFEKNIKKIISTLVNFYKIKEYCNIEFEKIEKQYNSKPMIIDKYM